MEQRFTFNEIANIYDIARAGYPEALIDDIISYAGAQPNDAILEVGCGTGQATKSFALRGFPILAIEPGPDMVRVARDALAKFANVEIIETTLERWRPGALRFRLIIAAQSWHWVSPQIRFAKAAAVLSPKGTLAIFGHVPVGLPGKLRDRLEQIYSAHVGALHSPPETLYLPSGPVKGWFDDSGLFGAVLHKCYPWTWRHTTTSYINVLRTRSDHRILPAATRDALLEDVAAAIDREGGAFEADYESHLYMAVLVTR